MKLSLDDALISTDIDKLIRFISEKQKTTLKDVESGTGVERRTIEKWIKVLEDEGYLDIDYKLTSTYLIWKGMPLDVSAQASTQKKPEEKKFFNVFERTPTISKDVVEKTEVSDVLKVDEKTVQLQSDSSTESARQNLNPELTFEPQHTNIFSREISNEVISSEPQDEQDVVSNEESLDVDRLNSFEKGEFTNSPLIDEAQSTIEKENENESIDSTEGNNGKGAYEELDMSKLDSIDENITSNADEVDYVSKSSNLYRSKFLSGDGDSDEGGDEGRENKEDTAVASRTANEGESESLVPDDSWSLRKVPERESATLRKTHEVSKQPNDLKKALNTYLNEMSETKNELESLKQEKARIHRENFTEIERKMEADIVSLTEKILEKESRILELKERYMELPDKVDEIEVMDKRVKELRDTCTSVVSRNKQLLQRLSEDSSSGQKIAQKKSHEIEEILETEREKLNSMESIKEDVYGQISEMEERLHGNEELMDVLNQKIQDLRSALAQSEEHKEEISSLEQELKDSIESREAQLEQTNSYLEDLKSVERNISEYLHDYEDRLSEIDKYIVESEHELAEIREAAEAEQMQTYVQDLDDLIGHYENELEETSAQENDIEKQISFTRKRLQDLVAESRGLIKNSRHISNLDYERISSKSKERVEKMKSMLDEKRRQRESVMQVFRSDDHESEDSEEVVRPAVKEKSSRSKTKSSKSKKKSKRKK